jgi:hypothetical protein
MKKLIQLLLFGFYVCSFASGQDAASCDAKRFQDTLLDKLTGQWDLSDKPITVFGQNETIVSIEQFF